MIIMLFASCNNQKDKNNRIIELARIDSVFNKHFMKLESIIKDKTLIEGEKEFMSFNETIDFFQQTTKIYSERDGTYFGLHYTQEGALEKDFLKWKNWYLENRNNLKWNSKSRKIFNKEDLLK